MATTLNRLETLELEGRTYLVTGNGAENKLEAVLTLSKKLLHTTKLPHPDFFMFEPVGKVQIHPVESMRQLKSEALRTPYQSPFVIIVVNEADRMQSASSNALLKIFEEPPKTTLIFLLTEFPERLLPTITSRCHTLPFQDTKESFHETPAVKALFNLLSSDKIKTLFSLQDALENIVSLISDDEKKREEILLLQQFLNWHRDLFLLKEDPTSEKILLKNWKDSLLFQSKSGHLIPIEQLSQEISLAKVSLERSIPLNHILENILVKYEYLCC